jgi:hypothetical protein
MFLVFSCRLPAQLHAVLEPSLRIDALGTDAHLGDPLEARASRHALSHHECLRNIDKAVGQRSEGR